MGNSKATYWRRREWLAVGAVSGAGAMQSLVSPLRRIANQQSDGPLRVIDVREFGAVADGQTDDRATIAAAARVAAESSPAILYFPPGTYLVGEGPPPQLGDGVVALGAGARSVLKRAPGTRYFALLVNADYAENSIGNRDIVVRDLTFDSNGAEQIPPYNEFKHGIGLIGVHNALVSNCRFINLSGDGIYVGSTIDGTERPNYSRNIRIADSHFEGQRQGRNGISVIDAEDVTISGNTFDGIASSIMPGGIDLEPNQPWERVIGVTIAANTFRDCRSAVIAYAANTEQAALLTIVGNAVNGTRDNGYAIGVLEWADGVIAENVISGPAGPGIVVTGCSGLVVQGNFVREGRSHGVQLERTRNASISGNVIRATDREAFHFTDCSLLSVSGNTGAGWSRQAAAGGSAILGSGSTHDVVLTGNAFDGENRDTTAVRTRDRCTGWQLFGNLFQGVRRRTQLVGRNRVNDGD